MTALYIVVDRAGHPCTSPHHIELLDVRPLIETGDSPRQVLSTGDTTRQDTLSPAGSTTSTPTTKDTLT